MSCVLRGCEWKQLSVVMYGREAKFTLILESIFASFCWGFYLSWFVSVKCISWRGFQYGLRVCSHLRRNVLLSLELMLFLLLMIVKSCMSDFWTKFKVPQLLKKCLRLIESKMKFNHKLQVSAVLSSHRRLTAMSVAVPAKVHSVP